MLTAQASGVNLTRCLSPLVVVAKAQDVTLNEECYTEGLL